MNISHTFYLDQNGQWQNGTPDDSYKAVLAYVSLAGNDKESLSQVTIDFIESRTGDEISQNEALETLLNALKRLQGGAE